MHSFLINPGFKRKELTCKNSVSFISDDSNRFDLEDDQDLDFDEDEELDVDEELDLEDEDFSF